MNSIVENLSTGERHFRIEQSEPIQPLVIDQAIRIAELLPDNDPVKEELMRRAARVWIIASHPMNIFPNNA